METKEQEAKEAWRKEFEVEFNRYRNSVYTTKTSASVMADFIWFTQKISDFQTALIETFNEEISNAEYCGLHKEYSEGLERAISLVKTVTPKKK